MKRSLLFAAVAALAAGVVGVGTMALREQPPVVLAANSKPTPRQLAQLRDYGAGLAVYDSGIAHAQYVECLTMGNGCIAKMIALQRLIDIARGLAEVVDGSFTPTPVVNLNAATGVPDPNSLTTHAVAIHSLESGGLRMLVTDADYRLVLALIAAEPTLADAGLVITDDAGGYAPPISDDGGVIGFAQ